MKSKVKKNAIKALRSKKYKQCIGALHGGPADRCVIGVLLEANGAKFIKPAGTYEVTGEFFGPDGERLSRLNTDLTAAGRQFLGINARTEKFLVGLNDNREKTLKELADLIERRY